MYYALSIKTEPLVKPKYISDMGTFNKLPTPWKDITADRYCHLAFTYTPHAIEFKQVRELKEYRANIYISYFHKYALGVVPPQSWTLKNQEIIYTEPIRYLYIGCEHKFQEKTVGHCLHEYSCELCGLQETVDSSG